MIYRDREEAGDSLAEHLMEEGVDADVVLGIPRGGLPVAAAVARAFDAELDVVAAKKLRAPYNEELAIGAAAADGSVWLNDDVIERVDVDEDYLEEETRWAANEALDKEAGYRDGSLEDVVRGRRVLVVDDGVATGATALACLRSVRDAGASYVAFAAPVGSGSSLRRLAGECDAVYCPERPRDFSAVGRYYDVFDQVSDEEAMSYLV